ncbi:MAG: Stp1/IreP family PP2C-type Ser/Thr phosphatase [Clostridiaceae bacterium]
MYEIISDIGNYRELNEDYTSAKSIENKNLYVVADGMGGYNGGEIASKLAVDTIVNNFNNLHSYIDEEDFLRSSIVTANKLIYENSKSIQELKGMGTTITACIIDENNMTVANVGDSCCFVIKKDYIKKITKDHSYVQELLDNGTITNSEAISHPQKNIITRALGTDDFIEIDIFKIDLNNVLYILLCTDGLSNKVSPYEIYDVIKETNLQDSLKNLVMKSKENGSRDNITAILIKGEC